jgi:hypothetical protein
MCPPDKNHENPHDAAADDSAPGGPEAAPESNKVVGPLTDDELKVGGLGPMQVFVRTDPTKEALRKKRQRKKQQAEGKRQINIVVPDNDRSRTTIRAAAAAIEDEVGHQAIEVILANSDLRPLIVDVAAQPALREIVDLARRKDNEQHSATAELLDAAKLVVERPEIVGLMKRATTTARMQETVESAIANPEYVHLGRIIATERSVCTWLIRLLLRIRRRRGAVSAPFREVTF